MELPATDPGSGLPKRDCDHTAPAALGQCKKCGLMIVQPEVATTLPTPDDKPKGKGK